MVLGTLSDRYWNWSMYQVPDGRISKFRSANFQSVGDGFEMSPDEITIDGITYCLVIDDGSEEEGDDE